jgi:outer membrane lipoprotein-sorting protein
MFANGSRPAGLATLLSVLLLSSAVAGVAVAGPPSTKAVQYAEPIDGDDVVDSFVDRIETLGTVEFTRTVRIEVGNRTTTTTVELAADLDDSQKRVETLQTPVGANTTAVRNGSDLVTYNHGRETITETEVSGPVLPRLQFIANDSLWTYEYLGTETVDGQETHAIEVNNQSTDPGGDTRKIATMYVDTETYFPVQYDSGSRSEGFNSTVTYENVTLGEAIPDARFELDVPTDIDQPSSTPDVDIEPFGSYEEFPPEGALSIPAASLPGGYAFESGVTLTTADRTSAIVSYTDGENHLSVHTDAGSMDTTGYETSNAWERIEVGETVGYIYSTDAHTSLKFEDGQTYTISGDVDDSTTRAIAESIVES